MSEKKKRVSEEPSTTPTTKPFQRFQRGTEEIDHHLFKLKLAFMKKNVSYKYRDPLVVETEHVHYFHSINDTTMQENKYSGAVGGHFHEVKLETDPTTGDIISAKCGPAVTFVQRKVAGGRSVRRVERVKWEKYNDGPAPELDENGEFLEPQGNSAEIISEYDTHVHELHYMGSERFTAQSKMESRKAETAKVKGLMSGQPVSRQPASMEKLTSGPGSDAARGVLVES
jgi:hypothetical protein